MSINGRALQIKKDASFNTCYVDPGPFSKPGQGQGNNACKGATGATGPLGPTGATGAIGASGATGSYNSGYRTGTFRI